MASLPSNPYTRRSASQPSINTAPPGRPSEGNSGGSDLGVTPPPNFNPLPQMAYREPPPPPRPQLASAASAPPSPVPQTPAHAVAQSQVTPPTPSPSLSPTPPGFPSAPGQNSVPGASERWSPSGDSASASAPPSLPEPTQTPSTPGALSSQAQTKPSAGAGAPPTPPGFPQRPFVQSFTHDHLKMMPPGHSVDTPLGTVTKNPDGSTSVHMNEAGRAHHARLVADETAKYGDHPFRNEEGAPQPPITPGGHHFNPFSGSWSDGWKADHQ